MNKKMIATIVVAFLAVIGVGYALVPHQTMQEKLESNVWHMTDTSGDSMTVRINHNRISYGQLGSDKFKINEDTQQVKIIENYDYQPDAVNTFHIEESKDGFILKPTNEDAKTWGTIYLDDLQK